ncbi:MAG: peptide chain release factor N(5)-glutamine methyltransferase [Bacteriovoracia bacterium]
MIPIHEKKILEAFVRKVPLNRLALIEEPLNEYEERELHDLVLMRMKGFPLQYLTCSQDFYGREFYVNTNVLIPRPETEGLVEIAVKQLGTQKDKKHGIDFGTGSGCIAISLALELPQVRVTGIDCSGEALEVAEENARKYRLGNVDFIRMPDVPEVWHYDGFEELDFIVSNPPYLALTDEIANDVQDHEPKEALFAPETDPMFFYRFLLDLVKKRLKSDGFAVFEIASNRDQETLSLFKEGLPNRKVELLNDLTGRSRYILVNRS